MNTYILDERNLDQFPSIHHWLSDSLSFPDWYGHNLDALYDLLTGWLPLPATIVWKAVASPDNSNSDDNSRHQQLLLCKDVLNEANEATALLTISYENID